MDFNDLCELARKNINNSIPDNLTTTELVAYFSLIKLAWCAKNKIWNKEKCEQAKNKIFEMYKVNVFHDQVLRNCTEKLKALEPYVVDFRKTGNIKSAEMAIDIFYGLIKMKF